MTRHVAIAAALALVLSLPVQAREVEIPMTIGMHHLESVVGEALGLDTDGRALLVHDDCNGVELSDLGLVPAGDRFRASLAVTTTTGTGVFGRCIGPGSWAGRLRVDLIPAVREDGLAVRLNPENLELRRPDGSAGVLTRPARALADRLVLPRLDNSGIDLRGPLNDLDGLIRSLVEDDDAGKLAGQTRLSRIGITEAGLRAGLVFQVEPRAEPSPMEPALDEAELARWQRLEDELDGLLTVVIARLASRAQDRDLRLEMTGVLLDTRLAIAESLAGEGTRAQDPVRELFIESWNRLRPHVTALEGSGALPDDTGMRLAAFVAGADAIRALDALGPEYGVEISRSGLRRLARMLLAGEAPATFTPLPLAVDDDLRRLFGMEPAEPATIPATAPGEASRWLDWLLPAAHADGRTNSAAEALRNLVPRLTGLDDYLALVAALLEQEIETRLNDDTRIPDAHRPMLDPLVRATAWKETCWRHYVGTGGQPTVIRSPVGAVGMMQINARVWRGIYDLDRLEDDVQYNVAAGIEILEHYLVDYALRRGEHEQPGGAENLARATYAAYNGGPGQMSRYRKDTTPQRLRAIDRAFWTLYEQVQKHRWPDVGSCYPV